MTPLWFIMLPIGYTIQSHPTCSVSELPQYDLKSNPVEVLVGTGCWTGLINPHKILMVKVMVLILSSTTKHLAPKHLSTW